MSQVDFQHAVHVITCIRILLHIHLSISGSFNECRHRRCTFNRPLVHTPHTTGFAPRSKQELAKAIATCTKLDKDCARQNPYVKKSYIYALQLEGNKFYVGKTSNCNMRISNHFAAGGSSWTRRYKPVKVLKIRESTSKCDEQIMTQEYMRLHGIDNVRGGPWCKARLTNAEKEVISKMIQSNTDCCYKCGEKGHFASECTACER